MPAFKDMALGEATRDTLNEMYDALTNSQQSIMNLEGVSASTLGLGWADYADSTYSEGSPFAVSNNTDTVLPNDGLNGPKTYAPDGIDLYDADSGVITGREGDGLLITLELTVERQSNSGEFDFEVWWDIGGAVGELYRRYFRIRGGGLDRRVSYTTAVYTLDTWEDN